jgi:hypothetical protein
MTALKRLGWMSVNVSSTACTPFKKTTPNPSVFLGTMLRLRLLQKRHTTDYSISSGLHLDVGFG